MDNKCQFLVSYEMVRKQNKLFLKQMNYVMVEQDQEMKVAVIINNYCSMDKIKGFILQWDFFSHTSLQRYKQEQSYRTLIGGVISIILVIFFFAIFFNLTLNTFRKQIIISDTSTSYDEDPSSLIIKTDPKKSFMFAVGISGLDLNSPSRFFDIAFKNQINKKNGSSTIRQESSIPLQKCAESQWKGMGSAIENSFNKLNFVQWLCPPTGQEIPLQGKFTSDTFQFSEITVSKCTKNNSLFPNTTCLNQSDVSSYLSSNGELTINFYFVNPVLNPSQQQFISYYLEDRNYFSFNRLMGVSSDLYFSGYSIDTDTSFFPWTESAVTQGFHSEKDTSWRNYQLQGTSSNQYFKLFLRKSAASTNINRSFQKLDQTFSYIGGLFGTIILLLIFLKLYSKYSYELEFADQLFKENDHGIFGSQKFNFVVFIGYCIYATFALFGININWKRMKRYHQCREQVQKQLNIDLLYKKVAYFQEAISVILKKHQLKMLLMTPKPTIQQCKHNRQRFLIRKRIYNRLQKKGNEVYIGPQSFMERLEQFLKQHSKQNSEQLFSEGQLMQIRMKEYQNDNRYSKTNKKLQNSDLISQKVVSSANLNRIAQTVLSYTDKKGKEKPSQKHNKGEYLLPRKIQSSQFGQRLYCDSNYGSRNQLTSTQKIKVYNDLMQALQIDENAAGN